MLFKQWMINPLLLFIVSASPVLSLLNKIKIWAQLINNEINCFCVNRFEKIMAVLIPIMRSALTITVLQQCTSHFIISISQANAMRWENLNTLLQRSFQDLILLMISTVVTLKISRHEYHPVLINFISHILIEVLHN